MRVRIPTLNPTAAATATTAASPNQCSQCSIIVAAATSCPDNACFCPTAVALGPACSSCLLTVNVTEAAVISSIINECQSEFPTIAPIIATVNIDVCSACATINSAATCPDGDACFCPTLIQLGPACSACLATINATAASVVGSIMSNCQTEFNTLSTTTPITSSRTTTPITFGALPTSTSTSHSGALSPAKAFLQTSWIHVILFLSFIAGVFSLVA